MIKQRIQQIVYDKTENNYSEFCRKTGLSNGFIHSISEQVQEKTIRKIMRAFPDINENWLREGIGDMYKTEKKELRNDEFYKKTINNLLEQLALKDRIIEVNNTTIMELLKRSGENKLKRVG